MVSLTADDTNTIRKIVERQTEIVAARYEGVEPEDLAQEVWVWILEDSAPALAQYIADDHLGRLTKAVYNYAVKWCERDKRQTVGYSWRDEYNYSRPEVSRLLPMALDIGAVPGLTGRALDDSPSAKSDPAYGGDLLASLIDVRGAYAKLSEPDQQFILVVVGLDSNWDQIAATSGILANSAYAKYMRILDRMVTRHLGRKTEDDDDES